MDIAQAGRKQWRSRDMPVHSRFHIVTTLQTPYMHKAGVSFAGEASWNSVPRTVEVRSIDYYRVMSISIPYLTLRASRSSGGSQGPRAIDRHSAVPGQPTNIDTANNGWFSRLQTPERLERTG